MDLLEQYKQQHPEMAQNVPVWSPPREYGFFIRLVMRMSGGKIRDVNTASYVLAIASAVIVVVSIGIFTYNFFGSGTASNLIPHNIDQRQFSGGR